MTDLSPPPPPPTKQRPGGRIPEWLWGLAIASNAITWLCLLVVIFLATGCSGVGLDAEARPAAASLFVGGVNPIVSFAFLLIIIALISLYTMLKRAEGRIRELEDDGWSSQLMTWREYCDLPQLLHGSPCWETGGEGPDRLVIVWTRTFIGRPDMKDVL